MSSSPASPRSKAPRPGQQAGDAAGPQVGGGFRLRHHVDDARLLGVDAGAAEPVHVDALAGDGVHDVGAGDEHPGVRRHDHDVGERGTVGRRARRRAEHDRDLRHPARGPDHRLEHAADAVHRLDAVGQARAARVP